MVVCSVSCYNAYLLSSLLSDLRPSHTHTFNAPPSKPLLLLIHVIYQHTCTVSASQTQTHTWMHMCARSHLQMEEISSLLPVSAKDVRCSDGTLTIGPMTAVHIGLTEQSMQSVFNSMRIVSVKQWLCAPLRIRKG